MPRSRMIFLLIIGAAILFVVAGLAIQRVPPAPTATPRPPLQVEVAVNPMAYDWVNEQAAAFNAQQIQVEGQTIQIRVTQRDGIEIWQSGGVWSSTNHPVAWIPEASFALNYAADTGLRYEVVVPSLASTPLIWGVFADRADVLVKLDPNIDWIAVQKAAEAQSWDAIGGLANLGSVKPVFARPTKTTSGYAALLSAAATFKQTDQLTAQTMNDSAFQVWMGTIVDAVPSFATLGSQPAAALASRGASIGDFGLLPESEWLTFYSTISNRQALRFAYPAYTVNFDMPLAIWSGAETTPTERNVVQQFGNYLQQEAAQRQAAMRGLRPAKLELSSITNSMFSAASGAGIVTTTPTSKVVTAPPSSGAKSILSWFDAYRPAS
jgi:hypothetical protein